MKTVFMELLQSKGRHTVLRCVSGFSVVVSVLFWHLKNVVALLPKCEGVKGKVVCFEESSVNFGWLVMTVKASFLLVSLPLY